MKYSALKTPSKRAFTYKQKIIQKQATKSGNFYFESEGEPIEKEKRSLSLVRSKKSERSQNPQSPAKLNQ